jgi:hypothetical protein
MITTVDKIKTLNQITNNTYDTLISTLIPMCESEIYNYCNNYFTNTSIILITSDVEFLSTTPSIILQQSNDFKANTHINISGSIYNDGNYKIVSKTNPLILIVDNTNIIDEVATTDITIKLVSYPRELELALSQMVNFRLQKDINNGVKSEKIDDYSITYGDISTSYPLSILNILNKYRKLRW